MTITYSQPGILGHIEIDIVDSRVLTIEGLVEEFPEMAITEIRSYNAAGTQKPFLSMLDDCYFADLLRPEKWQYCATPRLVDLLIDEVHKGA